MKFNFIKLFSRTFIHGFLAVSEKKSYLSSTPPLLWLLFSQSSQFLMLTLRPLQLENRCVFSSRHSIEVQFWFMSCLGWCWWNSYIVQDELQTDAKRTLARLVAWGRKWTTFIFFPLFVPGSLFFLHSLRRLHFFLLFIHCIDFSTIFCSDKMPPTKKPWSKHRFVA